MSALCRKRQGWTAPAGTACFPYPGYGTCQVLSLRGGDGKSKKAPGPDVALRLGICTEASSDRHVLPVPAVISALSRILKTSSFRRQEEV